jgi:transposase
MVLFPKRSLGWSSAASSNEGLMLNSEHVSAVPLVARPAGRPSGVGVGRREWPDRRVISGIVLVLKSGCRWCDCPAAYGPPTTIYNRFVRWARRGVWESLFRELAGNGRSATTQMLQVV